MNEIAINNFVKTFSRDIQGSNAAIFAGAGLSKDAGFVNWKGLMRDIAREINLDIDRETDLIAVAQYHVNEHVGRGKINQTLVNEFTQDSRQTEGHKILARLPIKTYWTTNYDTLIEDTLKSVNKRPDVKITSENLSYNVPNSEAIVYKMHGDISMPNQAVVTKDDYEGYNLKRQMFTTALQGDLVSKTFLFIGFSFDDPNLGYILARIRILLGENQRQHYCFMKAVLRNEFDTEDDFLYNQNKQNLRINDLKRYGIKVLLLDRYSDITLILKRLESQVKRKNIFISASASDYGPWGQQGVYDFASALSKAIIKNGNDIVTGFGLGIGSCVISGALEEIYEGRGGLAEERLKARPFPQVNPGNIPLNQLWTKHREDMIKNVGIAIFMFGNKFHDSKVVNANGMEEEFKISIENRVVPIPIGATGYESFELWKETMTHFDEYIGVPNLKPLYEIIGDKTLNINRILETVIEIIKRLRD